MRKLLISLLAVGAALSPLAASTAMAGAGASGARLNEGYTRSHDGNRGDRDRSDGNRGGDNNWNRGDNGGDRNNWRGNDNRGNDRNAWRGNDNRWSDNNRAQLADRRWDRRDDRWDRRDDRRDDRWDRRDDRRDRWSSRDRWDRSSHNGYYYRNAWYFGPPPSRYYNDRYYRPGYRSWERGYRVPSYYRDNVVYYGDYRHLRRPPHGYRWVRADNDFLLVAIASGIIAEVILNDY